jgi:hypothetical protein
MLCGNDSVPSFSENSCNCEELMCQCCLKLKGELQEMLTNLKSATAISNILNEELDIVYDMNKCSRAKQGHGESNYPTPHQLKRIPVTAKCQWRKRNSTIDQLKTNVQTNNHFEVLSNLHENLRLQYYITGDEASP